jgi:hypothetical protein
MIPGMLLLTMCLVPVLSFVVGAGVITLLNQLLMRKN